MCNPMAFMAASASSSAVGALNGAMSQKSSLGFQADLAEINARMSESAAQQTLLSGQYEEGKSRIATANLKGSQRASLAANGVDLGEGSAAQILTSTDFMGEVDATTIQANAVRSAWGQRTQSVNYKNQALMARSQASAINPTMAMVTSLIGSAGAVAPQWSSMKGAAPTPSPTPTGGTFNFNPFG